MRDDKLVQVCSSCLKATCWYNEFMCDESRDAGVVLKTVKELRGLGYEHEDYWSDKYMAKIYGESAPFGYSNCVRELSDYERYVKDGIDIHKVIDIMDELHGKSCFWELDCYSSGEVLTAIVDYKMPKAKELLDGLFIDVEEYRLANNENFKHVEDDSAVGLEYLLQMIEDKFGQSIYFCKLRESFYTGDYDDFANDYDLCEKL